MSYIHRRADHYPGQFGSYLSNFLERWKGTIEDGDVFLTNGTIFLVQIISSSLTKFIDPYSIDGAISHLNDLLVILPVFYKGKRVAWTANQGHFTEYVTK